MTGWKGEDHGAKHMFFFVTMGVGFTVRVF